jgi:uncharacterized membrane protein
MNSKNHQASDKHPKQDFQVERIAFFSDAVFAIALTLLVIEFRSPEVTKETTESGLWHEVMEMKFKLASVLLSFFLIINYWMRHHTLFKHIHNYNRKIISANMFTLLPVIFFPFTTSFLYESLGINNEAAAIPYRLFLLNNVLAGVSMFYFYWMVMKKYKLMSYPMEAEDRREFEGKLVVMTMSFLLVLLISFFSTEYSIWGILPIGIYNLGYRFFAKKKSLNKANAK